jgi:phosphoribosylanthranilate isomerase
MDVNVKICGLTNVADVQAAMTSGADLLGFIFFPKSPRYVTPERVRDILATLEPARTDVSTVGVFVDESPESVAQVLDFCGLDLAQLHGAELPVALGLEENQSPLRGRAYKALRPRTLEEATKLADGYALPPHLRGGERLPAFLLDAYHPHLPGGTGNTSDWLLASSLASRYPLVLAGGLGPNNVAQALQIVRPWGVDTASGIEQAPGQKDHAAMRAFVAAARAIQGEKTR